MEKGLLFWILMLFWLVLGLYWRRNPDKGWYWIGDILLFILLALLGWSVFGPGIKGL